jgi:hypothetical protein
MMNQKHIEVPPFKMYYPSRESMTAEQGRFFDWWVTEWKAGRAIPVNGNISYLYCYLYSVLAKDPSVTVEELTRFRVAFHAEPDISEACSSWISDAYVTLGDYGKALEEFPEPRLGSRASNRTDSLLSLRLLLQLDVDALSLLTLAGPNVTAFGRKHLESIESYISVQLAERHKHYPASLLADWARDSHRHSYSVFGGSALSRGIQDVPAFSFSLNKRALAFAAQETRSAENAIRDEQGLPAVGEGWVSETELYYLLKAEFPDTQVIQHASPAWLGQQHLDVLLPEHGVAVEYQGSQHDRPVEYFGGNAAFKQVRRRDASKKRKCIRNAVVLIEVRPGYDIAAVAKGIRDTISQRTKNIL